LSEKNIKEDEGCKKLEQVWKQLGRESPAAIDGKETGDGSPRKLESTVQLSTATLEENKTTTSQTRGKKNKKKKKKKKSEKTETEKEAPPTQERGSFISSREKNAITDEASSKTVR
jgi:hypothetical protein